MMSLVWPIPLRPRWWLAAMRGRDGAPSPRTRTDAATGQFEAFFRRYEPELTGYLWRMTGDTETAHDLCQETFTRAWQRYAHIAGYAQPRQWLYRVATNLALNLRRRLPTATLDDHDPAMSDPTGHVVEREQVRQILAELAPKPRAILILREVQQFSYAEIGALVGMSPDAVKMAVSRARAQFRQRYLTQEHD
ncbi:MAG: sigma-70 family RNA polymerase sigma factor [Ktedonobacterales bacterium]|nr:sigma-70 family RNA polymerase sigma factor [Ktedonobacterales bacterium]